MFDIFSKFASHQSRLSQLYQDNNENYNFVTSEAKRNFLRSQPSSPCRGVSGVGVNCGHTGHTDLAPGECYHCDHCDDSVCVC